MGTLSNLEQKISKLTAMQRTKFTCVYVVGIVTILAMVAPAMMGNLIGALGGLVTILLVATFIVDVAFKGKVSIEPVENFFGKVQRMLGYKDSEGE